MLEEGNNVYLTSRNTITYAVYTRIMASRIPFTFLAKYPIVLIAIVRTFVQHKTGLVV